MCTVAAHLLVFYLLYECGKYGILSSKVQRLLLQ